MTRKKVQKVRVKKQCIKCLSSKHIEREFFKSQSELHADGRMPICKDCLRKMVDVDDLDSVFDVLRQIDKPFIYWLWESSVEAEKETFGMYMQNVGLKQNRLKTWADSEFGDEYEVNEKNNHPTKIIEKNFDLTDELFEFWGYGYSNEEYKFFEKKYHKLKTGNYIKSEFHKEALKTYIRYQVKAELETAKGNINGAKAWGKLAKDSSEQARINPSQLDKSDLSEGLDAFGDLVRMAEREVDIIPILPEFKEKPQDKVDFNLWCYVNYIRDLKGLPPAEYSDIYRFYEERKNEYQNIDFEQYLKIFEEDDEDE